MHPRKLLEFLNIMDQLKRRTRHNWILGDRQESVADHCWRLAIMALLLEDEFPDVDIHKVVTMCLIHDIGEAITGDIPSFLKTAGDEKAEDMVVADLLRLLPARKASEFAELFWQMAERATPEAKLWKALDNLEAVISHNEAPLDTWLALERELNLTYGTENCAYSDYLAALREEIRQDTIKKLATENE